MTAHFFVESCDRVTKWLWDNLFVAAVFGAIILQFRVKFTFFSLTFHVRVLSGDLKLQREIFLPRRFWKLYAKCRHSLHTVLTLLSSKVHMFKKTVYSSSHEKYLKSMWKVPSPKDPLPPTLKLVLEAYIGVKRYLWWKTNAREVSTGSCTLLVMLLSVIATMSDELAYPLVIPLAKYFIHSKTLRL